MSCGAKISINFCLYKQGLCYNFSWNYLYYVRNRALKTLTKRFSSFLSLLMEQNDLKLADQMFSLIFISSQPSNGRLISI
jgi:hypothetical protein